MAEIYDMSQMTAAHWTLPFGTWVGVEKLLNRQTAEVRVTDWGTFVEDRILDLSAAPVAGRLAAAGYQVTVMASDHGAREEGR